MLKRELVHALPGRGLRVSYSHKEIGRGFSDCVAASSCGVRRRLCNLRHHHVPNPMRVVSFGCRTAQSL